MIRPSNGNSLKFLLNDSILVIFNIISVTKVELKVRAKVDHLFFLSLRILWHLYNTSLRTIDALAALSNNILIVHTLEFLDFYSPPKFPD